MYNAMTTRKFKDRLAARSKQQRLSNFFFVETAVLHTLPLQNFKFHGRPSAIEYGRATRGGGGEIRRRIKGKNSNGRQDERGNLHMLWAGWEAL